ncbi:hypothetical protein IF1G_02588 [Cordyceps javanica]|uniref:Uncharacterized protein n=1 Tax=Cordyceps javanica TaxID=43265 RepID=A0A545V9V7_9HYPO|nr:hypothetical protein IF1G_02588 [Cordyceps javanica]
MRRLPSKVALVNATARYHVWSRLLAIPFSTSVFLSCGTSWTISVRPVDVTKAGVRSGTKEPRLVDSWFENIVCATETKTAGPKCCANRMMAIPRDTSSVESTVCTALIGQLNATPLAKPNVPEYKMSFTMVVPGEKVDIRPANIGISTEAKSMNGV